MKLAIVAPVTKAPAHSGGSLRRSSSQWSEIDSIAAASTQGSSAAALAHGFQTWFYVLTGLLLFGAVMVVTLVRPPRPASVEAEPVLLEEAA